MNNKPHISLQDIGTELPFSVPDHYFDDLADRMEAATAAQRPTLRHMMKSWLYMAALFAGVLLLGNLAYILYQRNTSLKLENYERYLLSQVDEGALIDFYYEDLTETEQ